MSTRGIPNLFILLFLFLLFSVNLVNEDTGPPTDDIASVGVEKRRFHMSSQENVIKKDIGITVVSVRITLDVIQTKLSKAFELASVSDMVLKIVFPI